jgi:hypothetical protein
VLIQVLADQYDLADAFSLSASEWWDPTSARWDPERFKGFVQAYVA